MQSSLLYFIKVLTLFASIAEAEYAVYGVNKAAPGNFETVVFYDSWAGCMTFAKDIVCWFKQDEDDISTSSTVEFYTGTGCNGLFVGAWDFASVGIESIKTFSSDASVTARSIRVTGNGAKRSTPTSQESSNMTLISDGSSRELIATADLSTRALHSRSEVDALKLVLAGDEIWSLANSGGWAKYIIMKPSTGRDISAALLPCSSSTTRNWAASMATTIANNVLTEN